MREDEIQQLYINSERIATLNLIIESGEKNVVEVLNNLSDQVNRNAIHLREFSRLILSAKATEELKIEASQKEVYLESPRLFTVL
ncbi:MAG: hypothetical protein R6V83_14330 [Candidatus Thorarchaeota archaeon]